LVEGLCCEPLILDFVTSDCPIGVEFLLSASFWGL
jgi:hypothetical protein